MTQQVVQERLKRFAMVTALAIVLLFGIAVLQAWRSSRPLVPQPLEIPKEPPDIALLVTANRQGKLEVCGCPGKRAEDLAKVANLLVSTKEQLQRQGAVVGIVEGGDFVGGSDVVPYLLRAYQVIGYQCIALSPRDEKRLTLIRTNLGTMQLLTPSYNNASIFFELRGKGLALILVNLGRPSWQDGKNWQQIAGHLKSFRQHPNTVIAAVAYLSREEGEKVAPYLRGAVDILFVDDSLATVNGGFALNNVQREVSGVHLVALPQARSAILSLLLWQGKTDRERFRLQARWVYASGYPDLPQVKKIVDEYYAARQKELEREMQAIMKIASQREYLPPEFCGKCHQAQYDQWLETGHAHAIETLVKAKRMDKACLTCHSLEFRLRRVVTEKSKRGVECVDCHVELQDPAMAKMHGQRPGERPTSKIVNEQVCLRCHDQQNSPNFNLQTYLPKVVH
ncbi:MAG: hypothetical protein C4295_04420 [Candidatus Fervidibacterota bacterium]